MAVHWLVGGQCTIFSYKSVFFENVSPFCGTTDTPVLDFWGRLLWVSKPAWIPHLPACYSSDSPLVRHLLTTWPQTLHSLILFWPLDFCEINTPWRHWRFLFKKHKSDISGFLYGIDIEGFLKVSVKHRFASCGILYCLFLVTYFRDWAMMVVRTSHLAGLPLRHGEWSEPSDTSYHYLKTFKGINSLTHSSVIYLLDVFKGRHSLVHSSVIYLLPVFNGRHSLVTSIVIYLLPVFKGRHSLVYSIVTYIYYLCLMEDVHWFIQVWYIYYLCLREDIHWFIQVSYIYYLCVRDDIYWFIQVSYIYYLCLREDIYWFIQVWYIYWKQWLMVLNLVHIKM